MLGSLGLWRADKAPTIFWLDNRISDYQAIIDGLNKHGLSVEPASSLTEATKVISERGRNYHLFFLDALLEGETSLELFGLISARNPKAVIVVLSGYLFLENIFTKIQELRRKYDKLRVVELDKSNLPMPEDDMFEEFASQVKALCKSGTSIDLVPVTNRDLLDSHRERIDFPAFSDFMVLSHDEQAAFIDKMYLRHKEAIDGYLNGDFMWVCYCGTWDKPAYVAEDFDDVLPAEKLLDLGVEQGFAPIAFSKIDLVDDVIPRGCSKNRGLSGYPVVKIENLGKSQNPTKAFVHFDTGNPISMVCDKTFTEEGWLSPSRGTFERSELGGERVFIRKFVLEGTLATDAVGVTRTLNFTGIAVQKWETTRFAAKCAKDCKTSGRVADGVCKFRSALLGRTFQRECVSLIAVDCSSGEIFFTERPKAD